MRASRTARCGNITVSDAMVNLNRVEIFGMAILEAMYYDGPVVAGVPRDCVYLKDGVVVSV